MSRWLAPFDRWWFPVIDPTRLAVIRVFTGVFSLWYLCRRGLWLKPFFRKSADLWDPIGLTTLLAGPLETDVVIGLGYATVVTGVMFTIGLWWRVVGPLFGVLLLFSVTYRNSWGMLFHTENTWVIHVLILGFTASADRLAVDPWIRQRFGAPILGLLGFVSGSPAPHWRYGWPVKMLQLTVTLPYVVAAFAKVRGPAGWDWMYGENLRDQVGMNGIWYAMTQGRAEAITYYIYDYDWPWVGMALLTLVVEFGAPLALVHRRIGYAFVAIVLGLHYGIWIVMGIGFKYQVTGAAFVCFLEWERLGGWVASIRARFARWRVDETRAPQPGASS